MQERCLVPLGPPRGCARALTGSLPCWDHLWAELQGAASQQFGDELTDGEGGPEGENMASCGLVPVL